MQYVVFDLEFKQDLESLVNTEPETNILSPKSKYPYEIIQIGAVKLDENLNMTDTFNRYVKPSIYARISPYIIELTGITPEKLLSEAGFDQVYKDFIKFIGDTETTLCVWGVTDIKTLHKNIMYHNLDENLLPQKFINIQPYASVHLGQSKKRLLSLSYCAREMGIETGSSFHDALHDALYTAEIFRILFRSSIKPNLYQPVTKDTTKKTVKKVLNLSKLIAQFEKMFSREMTDEEKEIIRLAYHMGKTGQFLETEKPVD